MLAEEEAKANADAEHAKIEAAQRLRQQGHALAHHRDLAGSLARLKASLCEVDARRMREAR